MKSKTLQIEAVATDSSFIKGIGYSTQNKTLGVQFANGSIKLYDQVPQQLYNRFKTATSKGKFYNRHIKGTFDSKQPE